MPIQPKPGSTAVVVGCGRSGIAATRLLRSRGVSVTVVDDALRTTLGEGPDAVESVGATCRFGQPATTPLPEAQWIVVSPGVPTRTPRFAAATAAGATMIGEVALASWYCPAPMLVVTGTNGKTTTATLLHHLLCAAGLRSVLAGNVGTAFSGVVDAMDAEQLVVLEVSSYQLEHASGFAPLVGAVLNLTPDHMDRYDSFDDYVAVKCALWSMLRDDGCAVANTDDPRTVHEAAAVQRPVRWFGYDTEQADGATVAGDHVVLRRGGEESAVLPVGEIPLVGRHNVSNVLAALACASWVCDDLPALAEGVRTFQPVAHRLEPVAEVAGVQYVNDSKATNVTATATALSAMSRPVVLLMGGRGKGARYAPLRPLLTERVRHLVVYGEDAPQILAELADAVSTTEAAGFDAAVAAAAAAAMTGDVVLLSPACASFDMFPNFEARGHAFRALVEAL